MNGGAYNLMLHNYENYCTPTSSSFPHPLHTQAFTLKQIDDESILGDEVL